MHDSVEKAQLLMYFALGSGRGVRATRMRKAQLRTGLQEKAERTELLRRRSLLVGGPSKTVDVKQQIVAAVMEEAEANERLGLELQAEGNWAEMLLVYRRYVALALELDRGDMHAKGLASAGAAQLALGNPDEALDTYSEQLELARTLADAELEELGSCGIGQACLARGDLRTAKMWLAAAMQLATDRSSFVGMGRVLVFLGDVALAQSSYQEAKDCFNAAAAVAVRAASLGQASGLIERQRQAALVLEGQAKAALGLEGLPAATALFEKLKAVGEETQDALMTLRATKGIAAVLSFTRQWGKAAAMYEQCMGLVEQAEEAVGGGRSWQQELRRAARQAKQAQLQQLEEEELGRRVSQVKLPSPPRPSLPQVHVLDKQAGERRAVTGGDTEGTKTQSRGGSANGTETKEAVSALRQLMADSTAAANASASVATTSEAERSQLGRGAMPERGEAMTNTDDDHDHDDASREGGSALGSLELAVLGGRDLWEERTWLALHCGLAMQRTTVLACTATAAARVGAGTLSAEEDSLVLSEGEIDTSEDEAPLSGWEGEGEPSGEHCSSNRSPGRGRGGVPYKAGDIAAQARAEAARVHRKDTRARLRTAKRQRALDRVEHTQRMAAAAIERARGTLEASLDCFELGLEWSSYGSELHLLQARARCLSELVEQERGLPLPQRRQQRLNRENKKGSRPSTPDRLQMMSYEIGGGYYKGLELDAWERLWRVSRGRGKEALTVAVRAASALARCWAAVAAPSSASVASASVAAPVVEKMPPRFGDGDPGDDSAGGMQCARWQGEVVRWRTAQLRASEEWLQLSTATGDEGDDRFSRREDRSASAAVLLALEQLGPALLDAGEPARAALLFERFLSMSLELEPNAVREAAEEQEQVARVETASLVAGKFTASMVEHAIEVTSPPQKHRHMC